MASDTGALDDPARTEWFDERALRAAAQRGFGRTPDENRCERLVQQVVDSLRVRFRGFVNFDTVAERLLRFCAARGRGLRSPARALQFACVLFALQCWSEGKYVNLRQLLQFGRFTLKRFQRARAALAEHLSCARAPAPDSDCVSLSAAGELLIEHCLRELRRARARCAEDSDAGAASPRPTSGETDALPASEADFIDDLFAASPLARGARAPVVVESACTAGAPLAAAQRQVLRTWTANFRRLVRLLSGRGALESSARSKHINLVALAALAKRLALHTQAAVSDSALARFAGVKPSALSRHVSRLEAAARAALFGSAHAGPASGPALALALASASEPG